MRRALWFAAAAATVSVIGCAAAPAPSVLSATAPPRATAPAPAPEAKPGTVAGTIASARPELAKPGTAIFISAKSASDGRMLAVDKLIYDGQALAFVLDERAVMMPGALEGDVIVTARYDQDGDAMTREPGDLTGEARATVPARDVKLVLAP